MSDQNRTSEPIDLDLDRFLGLPRLSGLRLSPDGRHLVVGVSRVDAEGKGMKSAFWRIDPAGQAPPRRLTRSAAGESQATFASDGSLLFTSARPDPDAKPDPDTKIGALWRLPMTGGEAALLTAPEGGVEGIGAARAADAIAFGAYLHPAATGFEDDAERAKARKEAGVGALLFEDYPIRHWDDWLAPRRRRLFSAPLPSDPEGRLEPKDLTGDAGPVFVETGFDLSPDSRTLVTVWQDFSNPPKILEDLVAVDTETGERRRLTNGDAFYGDPKISPDGRYVACIRGSFGTADTATEVRLWLIDLTSPTAEGRDPAPGLDLWPEAPVWLPDSSGFLFSADRGGYQAALRCDLASGEVTPLVSAASVSDLCPSPDGTTVYALESSITSPARIVRFSATGANQTPEPLPCSIEAAEYEAGSRVERIVARAADGTEVASWLVLPPDASPEHPAPLLVWVHGGPLSSWVSAWHWRWNPNLLVARGYAVLLPDPALSLGYGQEMVQRGWGQWGGTPYTDVMTATDAALERPEIDRTKLALLGGSYGGYMANWVAGQTDRFGAIVTHASLWNLRPFHGTTDTGFYWEQEMGDPYEHPELYVRNSPSEHVAKIKTPMLVIHGERDFRVPLSEALMLWTDLRRHGVPSRFLYFPDENHWILKPQNARIWYGAVIAFLDEQLLGKEWARPDLL